MTRPILRRAQYVLTQGPKVKMRGDSNGIPCEKQWCGR